MYETVCFDNAPNISDMIACMQNFRKVSKDSPHETAGWLRMIFRWLTWLVKFEVRICTSQRTKVFLLFIFAKNVTRTRACLKLSGESELWTPFKCLASERLRYHSQSLFDALRIKRVTAFRRKTFLKKNRRIVCIHKALEKVFGPATHFHEYRCSLERAEICLSSTPGRADVLAVPASFFTWKLERYIASSRWTMKWRKKRGVLLIIELCIWASEVLTGDEVWKPLRLFFYI